MSATESRGFEQRPPDVDHHDVSVPPPLPITPPPRVRVTPVGDSDRFETLDVMRGIAVCGILAVNIENFAMVREARYDPAVSGGAGLWNELVWLGTFLLADTKFIALFTILFGAGIAIFNERRRARRARGAWAVYYRRMFFLLALGAAHGLFLWRGDILYFYAFWGLVLYLAPRFPASLLMLAGLGLYAWHARDFSGQLADLQRGYSWWEQQIFQGGWKDQYLFRRQFEEYYLKDVPIEFAPHLVGLMLFGMATYKIGFLAGRGRTWPYAAAAAISLAAGLGLVTHGTGLTARFADAAAASEFVWGSFLLTIGYITGSIVLTHWLGRTRPLRGLAALGRMALTNYLMQSVICTTIFYGYGFGLYERTTRVEQFALISGIWLFQILFSSVWLGIFRFGPCEWVWRSFSYWRMQPLLRRASVSPGEPTGAATAE